VTGDALRVAHAELTAPRTGHRLFALWTVEHIKGCGRGAPVAPLFEGTGYHRWYLASADQLPRVLHTTGHSAATLPLTEARDDVEVTGLRTWLFVLPVGTLVAGLSIDFLDRRSPGIARPLPGLFADVDRDREALRIGEAGVLEACSAGCDEVPGVPRFAGDFHGVLSLAPGSLPAREELDRQLLMGLVSRRAGASRDAFLTARFPSEANRHADTAAAVTPGATALSGQAAEIERATVMCAVQAIGALAALRHIQRRAFAALQELRRVERESSLADRVTELGELEVDLSFGVEASLDHRLFVPSLPVEQLHRAMVDALSIERGSRVTGTMLVRLAAAIRAEESRAADAERQRSHARRTAAAAAAGVAGLVALPLAFLGSNASQVDADRSMFDVGYYWPYYLTLLAIVALTAVGARWYVRAAD
jgi:hypothetical protein